MKKNRLFSIVLLIALFLGLMLFVQNYKQDGQEIVPPVIEETTNLGQLVVNEGSSNKLKLSKKMNVANQNSIDVHATVNPDDVLNDKLTWTLEWSSASSENVNDYVTMQVSADTHSVTLTYKKAFNNQIILKATSVLTPSVNATLTLDCYKRTSNFSLDFGFETQDDDFIPTVNETQKTIDFSEMPYTGLSEYHVTDCDLFSFTQTGTVNVTNKKMVKFSLSSELITKLTQAGITIKANSTDEQEADEFIGLSINLLLNELINITDSNREQLYQLLGTVSYWFDMTCTVKDMNITLDVNSFSKTYKLQGFNISDGLSVTSINLDKTQIIF